MFWRSVRWTRTKQAAENENCIHKIDTEIHKFVLDEISRILTDDSIKVPERHSKLQNSLEIIQSLFNSAKSVLYDP